MKTEEMKFHHVVQTNEEGTDWVVVIGNQIATPRHFKTKKEAEEWAKDPKWEMIIAMILYLMEKKEELKKTIKNSEDGKN